ncbi:hybrid sensor histidine kinase/response regulator [Azospirillum sp. SYSU D00513]|uniref:PAS domain-containing hybrid sensor histidine kinase/response regulator n=1 Tax=Azospirillum sp. SYSU D00513 TaxID=2812561 RepID=UPI001A962FBD|nr:hybrid sensor histidine kinase/response regulator [Azospirillum sp. SYSU D00513]
MRAFDWAANPLGPPDLWPQPLRTLVGVMLGSSQPMTLVWGRDLTALYNDGYAVICGGRHPAGLGLPLRELWFDAWHILEPFVARSLAGESIHIDDLALTLHRNGHPEEAHFSFSYTPVRDERGRIAGIFCACTETTEKVRGEAALRASEERLQFALEAAEGVGTWDWNVAGDRVFANAGYARLFSVDPAAAAAGAPIRFFTAAIHPADRPRVEAAIRDAVETRADYAQEYRLLQPDGTVRWVHSRGRCHYDGSGRPVRFPGVTLDVSERKGAEEEARKAVEEFRILADSLPILISYVDTDRVYRFINRSYESWFGRPAAEILDHPVREVLGEAAYGYRAVFFDRAFAGEHLAFDAPLPYRDGQWRQAQIEYIPRRRADGAVDGVFVLAVDIEERKRAEAALAESDARFRAITDSIDQMIWSARPDGFHDYYNRRWYEYTGMPDGATDGEGWNGMFHPDDRERAWAAWRHSLETGEPYRIEYRLRHHSGRYRWVLGRAQPVRGPAGAVTRWFGTCTDIQDIVEARETLARSREELEALVRQRTHALELALERLRGEVAERERAEEQLRQSQKMEAIGQLTGGIAHDFNNLVQGIVGSLELVGKRLSQGRTGEVERFLTGAMASANRAAALTHRLLAFSRRQPLDPRPVQANQLLASMEDLLRRTMGERFRIDFVLAEGLWLTKCDANQLENAILNLAINARDAMPDGGRLTIETGNAQIGGNEIGGNGDGAARARDLRPGRYVRIRVTDTGSGMTPDVAARAFDPFFTTKPTGQGTGLGLSMIYGFCRQSEGHAAIDSEPGRGTSVALYLPRHQDGEEPPDAAPEDPAEDPRGERPSASGEVVLVVEDEAVVRGLIVELLEESGYRALEAADGPDGLRLLQSRRRIDLLVTDMGLPGLNGRQVADAARRDRPGLPVLFMTGYAENATLAEGFLEPGMELITKPFAMDALAARIRAMLEGL